MNDIAKESLLFDQYGSLLTEKKQNVMRLYHEENLTLSEIAEQEGISRAAVFSSLKSAERQLAAYEDRLGLVALRTENEARLAEIRRLAQGLERDLAGQGDGRPEEIIRLVDALNGE